MRIRTSRSIWAFITAAVTLTVGVHAQEPKPGKLKLSVEPTEAYTFVDGQAMGPGNRTVKLSPGGHSVIVANYGYRFLQQDVSVDSKQTSSLSIKLDIVGDKVAGPRGRIQLEVGNKFAAEDGAVLLNGKTPGYFVGHVDEFNNNIWWKQELIVPPGTHQVTVTKKGKQIWSGTVPVAANQRVIVTISNGKQKIKDWPRGTELPDQVSRFRAGAASATIDIAPVSSSVSVTPGHINCAQPSQLAWTSAETVDAQMSGMSPVPTNGDRTVSPKQTTTYDFSASGPGGTTQSSTTLEVNPVIESSLDVSNAELRYRRIGDKVMQQEGATVSWSTSNADSVLLSPVGTVAPNGMISLKATPTQTANGPLDETTNYTLSATNTCGGSATKAIAVHTIGSIEQVPEVLLQSVFFPTAYPDEQDPTVGLLASQRETLMTLADGYKKYVEYDPEAKLSIVAHTDPRGNKMSNQGLAARRADSVRQFLVAQGIPMEKIDTSAVGEEQPLDDQTITALESQNPNPLPQKRADDQKTTNLAYQRRVDIVFLPSNAESKRFYPNSAPDSDLLWQRLKPNLSEIQTQE